MDRLNPMVAQKESELGNLLNQLEKAATKTQGDMADLQGQLSPILAASRPDKDSEANESGASCEISHRIESLIGVIENIDRAIQDTRDRLAL